MSKENEVISDTTNKENLSNSINVIKEANKDITASINKNTFDEKRNKEFEDNNNDNLNSNLKEDKNKDLPLNENESKVMKEENLLDIKPKGYVRIFRKYIKKKHQIMNDIIDSKFKLWKKITLKGLKIKKTIFVRISISKEKDRKSKSYSQVKLNAGKRNLNNINIINQKQLLESNNTSEIKNTKYKRIFSSQNKENNNKTYNKQQNQKSNFNNTIENNSSSHKYNKINRQTNNNINNNNKNTIEEKVEKYNKKWRNPLIEISGEKPKKDQFKNIRYEYKNNINLRNKFNKIEISKNNFEPNSEIISSKFRSIYKSNNVHNKNNNKNERNNNPKDYYLKYVKNYNNGTITFPAKKTQNVFNSKEKKQYFSPYNTKKYIPQKKIYSEKKDKEYNSYFLKNFQKKNDIIKPMIKPIKLNIKEFNLDNYHKYANCTSGRAKFHNKENSFVDKKTLKRGITSVIQHFSGKIEEFINYDKSSSMSKKAYIK